MGNIKRLAVENVTTNLLDSIRGSISGGEITETKAPADTIAGGHNLAALDYTVFLEQVTKILLSNRISKVTDVKVGLGSGLVVRRLEPLSIDTLVLLLGTINVELHDNKALVLEFFFVLTFFNRANKGIILPLESLAIESLLGLDSKSVLCKVDETEATALTFLILHDDRRSDLTEFTEELLKISSVKLLTKVLNIDIGVSVIEIVATQLLGDELFNDNARAETRELLLVRVTSLKSLLRILNLLKLDETVAKAGSIILSLNLAGSDRTKVREDILKMDESHRLVKTLDIKVTLIALTLGGITTRPHHTARLTLKKLTIEGIKSLLSILRSLEVNVCITERVLILHITAHTNRQNCTTFLECIIDIRLTNFLTKITHIEGTIRIRGRGDGRGLFTGRHVVWLESRNI